MEKMKMIWRWVRQKPLDFFLWVVGSIGAVFFAVLISVMFNECIEHWAKGVLGSEYKRDTIKVIGLGIAGVLAIFGAVAVSKRANAQIKNNELIERGHIQERFKTAVEHLGSKEVAVRIASFYEFNHLARDNEDLRQNIFDILCAHLRQTTADKEYQEKIGFNVVQKDLEDERVSGISTIELADSVRVAKVIRNVRPTEEVQSLLDILFQSKDGRDELIFVGFISNLQRIFLIGASLHKANLHKADLRRANLRFADLRNADLRGADLRGAYLRDADLHGADLRGVLLYDMFFGIGEFLGIDSLHTHFLRADLHDTNLDSADLRGVDLQGVKNLRTAGLSKAKIKGAKFPKGYKPPADADND